MLKEGFQKKFIILIIVSLLVILSYKIISPYLITLISTFILVYMSRPLYLYLTKKNLGETFSAIICITIVLLVIIVPSFFMVKELTRQTTIALQSESIDGIISQKVVPFIENNLGLNLEKTIQDVLLYAQNYLKDVALKLPQIMISLLLMIMGMFYLLIYWDKLRIHLRKFIPVKKKKTFEKELTNKTNSIIFGTIMMAVLEGVISYLGFAAFGVPASALFALLIFFFAFIPAIGSSAVWIPLSIYYFFIGNLTLAIAVLVIGVIVGYGIDTALRAKILGKKSKINPFIMLLGILGGIPVFGIFGFIIGPLVLSYTIKILESFLE